jgi:hypothetical protein
MQGIIIWEVIPKSEPTVIKNCPKCGGQAFFESSKKFRVNANQSKLDVWLIYQCRKCQSTWNMAILSRVNLKEIGKERYKNFLNNDEELAKNYAFNAAKYMHNQSSLSSDEITYEVIGDNIELEHLKGTTYIKLCCKYPLDVRVDKILSYKLSLSREVIRRLTKKGCIACDEEKNIEKAKLKENLVIKINGDLIWG